MCRFILQITSMKKHINKKVSKENIRDSNSIISSNNRRSRIPVRIPLNGETVVKTPSSTASIIQRKTIKSVSFVPEKIYGKERNRFPTSYGKRFGKNTLESQISLKHKKCRWEKTKLIKQQLNYKKEYSEMKMLLQKLEDVGGDSELKVNESDFCNSGNGSGDSINLMNQFQNGCESNKMLPYTVGCGDNINSSVRHTYMTSNTEIFALLKGLGEKAIQLYYHQTTKNVDCKPMEDVNFFRNILKLKTKFSEATNEGNHKIMKYENELNQLKVTNADLIKKLKLKEQQLASQATENKSIHDSREESFMKIEEKLRGVIDKLQCQFRTQKLLQAKTERELAVCRSDLFSLELEKNKLSVEINRCTNELKECQKMNENLTEKSFLDRKENEELIGRYEQQLTASHTQIDRMENDLMEAKKRSDEYHTAQMKG